MALINCPECGRQISDRAPSCPGCGILKEDIQAMLAEQNAAHSSMEEKKKIHNNDVVESQGTEEEFLCYPTIAAISERERIQFSWKPVKKRQDEGRTDESFRAGDIVTFGTQDGEPISWIVLEMKGEDMLLLSEKCLEVRQFHSENKPIIWETSDIRRYLNGEFLGKYFSNREREMIKYGRSQNFDKLEWDLLIDQVLLLSADEIKRYFPDRESRMCEMTEHARKQVAETKCFAADGGTIRKNWWLRKQMGSMSATVCVNDRGEITEGDVSVNSFCMIRPALVVHLGE